MSVYVCVECGKPIEQDRYVEVIGYIDRRRISEFIEIRAGIIYCVACITRLLGIHVITSLEEVEKSTKWVVLNDNE